MPWALEKILVWPCCPIFNKNLKAKMAVPLKLEGSRPGNYCHSLAATEMWVYIKYKKYNQELGASAVLICLQNWWKNSTKLQKFSRRTGKLSVFPESFQGPGRKFQKFFPSWNLFRNSWNSSALCNNWMHKYI